MTQTAVFCVIYCLTKNRDGVYGPEKGGLLFFNKPLAQPRCKQRTAWPRVLTSIAQDGSDSANSSAFYVGDSLLPRKPEHISRSSSTMNNRPDIRSEGQAADDCHGAEAFHSNLT